MKNFKEVLDAGLVNLEGRTKVLSIGLDLAGKPCITRSEIFKRGGEWKVKNDIFVMPVSDSELTEFYLDTPSNKKALKATINA